MFFQINFGKITNFKIVKIGKSKDQNPTNYDFFYEIRKRIMEENLVVKTSLGPEKR